MITAEQPGGPAPIFISLEPDAELATQIEFYKQHQGPRGRFTCSRLQPFMLVNEHPVRLHC